MALLYPRGVSPLLLSRQTSTTTSSSTSTDSDSDSPLIITPSDLSSASSGDTTIDTHPSTTTSWDDDFQRAKASDEADFQRAKSSAEADFNHAKSSAVQTWVIVVAVVGSLVFLAFVGLMIFFWRRSKRQLRQQNMRVNGIPNGPAVEGAGAAFDHSSRQTRKTGPVARVLGWVRAPRTQYRELRVERAQGGAGGDSNGLAGGSYEGYRNGYSGVAANNISKPSLAPQMQYASTQSVLPSSPAAPQQHQQPPPPSYGHEADVAGEQGASPWARAGEYQQLPQREQGAVEMGDDGRRAGR